MCVGFSAVVNITWFALILLVPTRLIHVRQNGRLISGAVIPDITSKLSLVSEAHFKLMPDVPLVGWDVALTTVGVCLLEVNLSCNFFRGSFDVPKYMRFMHDYFVALGEERTTHGKIE